MTHGLLLKLLSSPRKKIEQAFTLITCEMNDPIHILLLSFVTRVLTSTRTESKCHVINLFILKKIYYDTKILLYEY